MRILRYLTRRGPVFIAVKLGMRASTVGRVLHRQQAPLLRELDPVTGTVCGRPANQLEATNTTISDP